MPPSEKCKYDWDTELRAKKHRQPSVGKERAKFDEEPTTLAWLDKFASKRSSEGGRGAFRRLEDVFPWLWNPYDSFSFSTISAKKLIGLREWDDTVNIDKAGVKQLKDAVRQAEAMENSLDIFLFCVKDRLGRLRSSLKHVASRSYFPFYRMTCWPSYSNLRPCLSPRSPVTNTTSKRPPESRKSREGFETSR